MAAPVLRLSDKDIILQPNAGKPSMEDSRPIFPMTPADFAEGMARCIGQGVHIAGGCCGTTTRHIRALAERLAGRPVAS